MFKKNTKKTNLENKNEKVIINVHSNNQYWLEKILNSNRYNSEITKIKKILTRFSNINNPIRVEIFIDPKKYFKHYKFNCKLHILGVGKKYFTVENYSENYLESITKSFRQSLKFLQHQSSIIS